jgi:hypothetical protein
VSYPDADLDDCTAVLSDCSGRFLDFTLPIKQRIGWRQESVVELLCRLWAPVHHTTSNHIMEPFKPLFHLGVITMISEAGFGPFVVADPSATHQQIVDASRREMSDVIACCVMYVILVFFLSFLCDEILCLLFILPLAVPFFMV